MTHKYKISFLLFLLFFIITSSGCKFTADISAATTASSTTEIQTSAVIPSQEPETEEVIEVFTDVTVCAPYAALYRSSDLICLFDKASEEKIYPASLTKLVTALTALKYVTPDSVFTVGTEQRLVPDGSSLCLIQIGHRLSLYHLICGMLMSSGNDAAYTVAVNVAKAISETPLSSDKECIEYFSGLMNSYVKEIGAINSNFTNPDGWDDYDQYTTVKDLAIIAQKALECDEIREIISCKSKFVTFASGQTITWNNTNALLYPESDFYSEKAIGMKTGTTGLAGKCLISAFNINNSEYICVVAGCSENDDRYLATQTLISLLK